MRRGGERRPSYPKARTPTTRASVRQNAKPRASEDARGFVKQRGGPKPAPVMRVAYGWPDGRALDGDATRTGKTGHVVDGRQAGRPDTEHGAERRLRGVRHRRVFHADRDEGVGADVVAGEATGQEAATVVGRAAARRSAAIRVRDAPALRVTRRERTVVVHRADGTGAFTRSAVLQTVEGGTGGVIRTTARGRAGSGTVARPTGTFRGGDTRRSGVGAAETALATTDPPSPSRHAIGVAVAGVLREVVACIAEAILRR